MKAVAFGVLAVAVPAGVLHLAAADARHAAGLTAAPFAWPRLLVAHLLTALPLGFVLAGWVRRATAADGPATTLWVVLGVGAAVLAAVLSPAAEYLLDLREFGPALLLVLRAATALALVLPWCIAGLEAPPPASRNRLAVALAVGAAVVPAGLYTERLAEARTAAAEELLENGRYVRAESILAGLCEVGSDRPVGALSPFARREEVAKELRVLRAAAETPLPAAASQASQRNRALVLMQLDRNAEAAEVLEPLAATDDTALRLLATTARDRGRWAESDAAYAEVLDRLLSRAGTDPAVRGACVMAFDGMAYNARMDGRPADAERVLLRGLDALPAEAARFHFLLGKHYADGGRPRPALDHLRAAARLDPGRYREPADTLVRHLRTSTYGCLLPGSSGGDGGSVPAAGHPASR